MAKTSIAQGREIDKLRSEIGRALARCKRQEARLTKAGVQNGHVHFKTDRPNTMFVLEPSVDGRRRYIHVGTNPERQTVMAAAVARWGDRTRLQADMAALHDALDEFDRAVEYALRMGQRVRANALQTVETHCRAAR